MRLDCFEKRTLGLVAMLHAFPCILRVCIPVLSQNLISQRSKTLWSFLHLVLECCCQYQINDILSTFWIPSCKPTKPSYSLVQTVEQIAASASLSKTALAAAAVELTGRLSAFGTFCDRKLVHWPNAWEAILFRDGTMVMTDPTCSWLRTLLISFNLVPFRTIRLCLIAIVNSSLMNICSPIFSSRRRSYVSITGPCIEFSFGTTANGIEDESAP